MSATIKCYWSKLFPIRLEAMAKLLPAKELEKYTSYDAKLTPEDVFEMQKIDADCNDCKHFQRGELIKGLGMNCFKGHCKKLAKPTTAWPMNYSGHECFEHRKE